MAKDRRNVGAGAQVGRTPAGTTNFGRSNYEFGNEIGAGAFTGAGQAGRAQRATAAGRQQAHQAGRRNRQGQ